jgi:hypothetical protein
MRPARLSEICFTSSGELEPDSKKRPLRWRSRSIATRKAENKGGASCASSITT